MGLLWTGGSKGELGSSLMSCLRHWGSLVVNFRASFGLRLMTWWVSEFKGSCWCDQFGRFLCHTGLLLVQW